MNTCATLLANNSTITVRELPRVLQIAISSIHRILHNHLAVLRVCTKWVPKLLTDEQQQQQVDLGRGWKLWVLEWFKHLVTIDESWAYLYDPLTNQLSS